MSKYEVVLEALVPVKQTIIIEAKSISEASKKAFTAYVFDDFKLSEEYRNETISMRSTKTRKIRLSKP